MVQKVIITDYPDGSRVMSNIRNKKGVPVFKENDTYTATRVTTWYDGTPMDDSKADGKVYLKHTSSGDYYRVNLPNEGELFLEKDTVGQMRDLSAVEILLLKMGYYKGVTLNGYYKANDTPGAIQYYLSDTVEEDDGGSVFEVGGIKLEHVFVGETSVKYFGADPSLDNNLTFIQKCINKVSTILIDDRYKIIVEEISAGISNSLTITGDKTVNFSPKGKIEYGIPVNSIYYPAFIILNNKYYKVIFNNPDFIYTGDFGKESVTNNNKFNLGILSTHFSAHILTYNSDVDINNFYCSGFTVDNVINIGISVHHSRCRINNAVFDDYCLGVLASRRNYDVIDDYLIVNNITAGRQSQKSFLVYGPPHLIYMNGHANFQANNIIDKGIISTYNGSDLTFDNKVFTPYFDGHTVKVVNATGVSTVTNVLSNRMEGILDVTLSSSNGVYKNLVWEIDDFIFGYYDWGAIRVDRGTTGTELPIEIEAYLKMKGGDRKFLDLRSDLSRINLIIEQTPAIEVVKPVVHASAVNTSNIYVSYKNNTDFKPQLIYIDRTCVRNEFTFDIKSSNPNNFGTIGFNVSGSQMPSGNIIKLKNVDVVDVSSIIETGTSVPLGILKNNKIYTGKNGDSICYSFKNVVTSVGGLSLNWEIPFLPSYNSGIDRINITAISPGDFYIYSQDFNIRKFGQNPSQYLTLSVDKSDWVINGTIVGFINGDGDAPSIGDTITVGGVQTKVKQLTITSGDFSTGDATGTITLEHHNRIDPSVSEITGNNLTATYSSKTTSFYEGLSISQGSNGLVVTSEYNRTAPRSYTLFLTIFNSNNYRP